MLSVWCTVTNPHFLREKNRGCNCIACFAIHNSLHKRLFNYWINSRNSAHHRIQRANVCFCDKSSNTPPWDAKIFKSLLIGASSFIFWLLHRLYVIHHLRFASRNWSAAFFSNCTFWRPASYYRKLQRFNFFAENLDFRNLPCQSAPSYRWLQPKIQFGVLQIKTSRVANLIISMLYFKSIECLDINLHLLSWRVKFRCTFVYSIYTSQTLAACVFSLDPN